MFDLLKLCSLAYYWFTWGSFSCNRLGSNTEEILLDILPNTDFSIYITKSHEFMHGVNMQLMRRASLQKTYNYIKKLVMSQSLLVRKQFYSPLHSIYSTSFSFVPLDLYINYMIRFQLLYCNLIKESLYGLSFALPFYLILTKRE